MTDVTDLRFARLAGALDAAETKAATPPKKGQKVRPKPPWLDDDTDEDDDAEDMPPKRAKKALPSSRKPPAGWTAKKPMPGQSTAKARRKQTVTSPRGNLARVQHNSRGTRVSMRTLPAPAGFRAKSADYDEKAAARPTVWGPRNQSVDITRARVATVGNDPRANAASRERFYGRMAKPGTGSAGGNGVTRGRGNLRTANPVPGNVSKRRAHSAVRHSGQMGEGAARGRSGSAITPSKPGNIKSLYDFTPDQLRSAMDVAAKAIRGVIADHDAAGE